MPGGAERIFALAEKQASHRMELEVKAAESDYKLARAGQWIGLTVVFAVLGLAGYLAYRGATTAAVTIAGIDLVGLAAVFVLGSFRKRIIHQVQVDDIDADVE